MYIIKQMWTDSFENNLSDAKGYNIIGYVNSKEEAETLVIKGGKADKRSWPPVDSKETKIIYEEIKEIDTIEFYTRIWKYAGESQEIGVIYKDGTNNKK